MQNLIFEMRLDWKYIKYRSRICIVFKLYGVNISLLQDIKTVAYSNKKLLNSKFLNLEKGEIMLYKHALKQYTTDKKPEILKDIYIIVSPPYHKYLPKTRMLKWVVRGGGNISYMDYKGEEIIKSGTFEFTKEEVPRFRTASREVEEKRDYVLFRNVSQVVGYILYNIQKYGT